MLNTNHDIWFLLKNLKEGTVVKDDNGQICTVESFTNKQEPENMLLILKNLCTQRISSCRLSKVLAVMITLDEHVPVSRKHKT